MPDEYQIPLESPFKPYQAPKHKYTEKELKQIGCQMAREELVDKFLRRDYFYGHREMLRRESYPKLLKAWLAPDLTWPKLPNLSRFNPFKKDEYEGP
jgi:hypothetical protein